MTLAFIVQAHHKFHQLQLLLDTLRDARTHVYLHVDAASPMPAIADDVTLLPRRRSRWGGADIVDVGLDGLRQGMADGCDYFVLLSGQCFPLRPVRELVEFFDGAPSYVESYPTHESVHRFHGRDRTDFYSYDIRGRREPAIPFGEDTSHLNWRGRALNTALRLRSLFRPRRRFPSYAQPHTGSAWWKLDKQAAQYVLDFLGAHEDYRPWFDDAWIPDEFFIQSILAGSGYEGEIVNDDLHFTVTPDGYHPRTLVVGDLPLFDQTGDCFGRKFDIDVDREVLVGLAARGART